jgi:hypothetical protein
MSRSLTGPEKFRPDQRAVGLVKVAVAQNEAEAGWGPA